MSNEAPPLNWQKKPVLSDHIPVPELTDVKFQDGELQFFDGSIKVKQNEYIFVATPPESKPARTLYEDWGASPSAFKVGRVVDFAPDSNKIILNWLVRPSSISKHAKDNRELFFSSLKGECMVTDFRGKCFVLHPTEMRNFERFRDSASSFWVEKYVCIETLRLFNIYPESVFGKQTREFLKNSVNQELKYIGCEPRYSESLFSDKFSPDIDLDDLDLSKWPCVFYDGVSNTIVAKPPKKVRQIGPQHQIEVDEWQGQPLVYYVMGPDGPRPVEPTQLPGDKLDTSLSHVQEMPQGYLARGSSATSTPISVPYDDLDRFVTGCRKEIAAEFSIRPFTAKFLDLCCSVYQSVNGDFTEGLELLRQTCSSKNFEPCLDEADLLKLRKFIDPFTHPKSWHTIFNSMKHVLKSDIVQYLWEKMPEQPWIPSDEILWNKDPPSTSCVKESTENPEKNSENTDVKAKKQQFKCVECLTTDAAEWKALPGYFPLDKPSREPENDHMFALCIRCARMWFRYCMAWYPYQKVKDLVKQGELVDPDLVADANSNINELKKRERRRKVTQEKRLQNAVKKLEDRKVKFQEKVNNGKAFKSESENAQTIEKINTEIQSATERLQNFQEEEEGSTNDEELIHVPSHITAVKPSPRVKNSHTEDEPAEDGSEDENEDDSDIAELSTPKKRKGTSSKAKPKSKKVKTTEGDKEKSRPRGRGPQLSIEKAAENLAKIKDHMGIKTYTKPEYCVICCQKDPSMVQYNCYFCRLSVHEECYGKRTILHVTNNNDVIWACDCCLNLLGKTDYKRDYYCKLCPKRPPLYLEWLNRKETEYSPDALKATTDGFWCHSRCAVFTPNVTFHEPDTLSGVNLSLMKMEQFSGECSVCLKRNKYDTDATEQKSERKKRDWESCLLVASKEGAKVKCDLCEEIFHVSCAADSGFHFGFTKEDSPRAVIICSKHDDSLINIHPMSSFISGTNRTFIHQYALKSMDGSAIQPKQSLYEEVYEEDKKMVELGDRITSFFPRTVVFPVVESPSTIFVNDENKICTGCYSKTEPFWLLQDEKTYCKNCYNTGDLGEERKMLLNKFTEAFSSSHQFNDE